MIDFCYFHHYFMKITSKQLFFFIIGILNIGVGVSQKINMIDTEKKKEIVAIRIEVPIK